MNWIGRSSVTHRALARTQVEPSANWVETTLLPHTQQLTQEIDELMRSAGYRSHRTLRDGRLNPMDVMGHKEIREDIIWRLGMEPRK